MLLNTLFNRFFTRSKASEDINKDEYNLSASILIGIDNKQRYLFDIKWDNDNQEQSSSDLANLILGLYYGLFANQAKDILLNHDTKNNPEDEIILHQTMKIIEERSGVLQNLLINDLSPVVKPSEVFRIQSDVNNKNH